jgi:hydroxyacylglutathione hydrolase
MLQVTTIPCLSDNYAYLLDDGSGELAVVDVPDAAPVQKALAGRAGKLTAILATHHHQDHVGGNEDLLREHQGVRVYGYTSDRGRIPGQTHFLADGETLTWGSTSIRGQHIPGHTLGAIAYGMSGVVFTGDTLFLAGCGRIFEGTPLMMFHSLYDVLGRLPPSTKVYCGHEYTVNNLLFAQFVEPGNGAVKERLAVAKAQIARGEPTVGTKLEDEYATNPFLRCKSAEIRASLKLGPDESDVDVFAALRRTKDTWRPPAS